MKKNKKEIVIIIGIIVFAILTGYFYKESKTIKSTGEIRYTEKSNINYKVYLTDKKYYNRDYLDEGMQYISSIIDYIDINYNYNVKFEQENSYTINKKVLADVKIVDSDKNDKIIYSKQDVIKEETVTSDEINLQDNIKIDYKKYNGLTNEFKTNYAISADCNLVVSYYVYYENEYGDIKQNRLLNVTIPLSQQMINITKSDNINSTNTYLGTTTKATINSLMLTISLILGVVTIILVLALIAQIIRRKAKESKYERFIKKILRDYDSYITESKEQNYSTNKPIIKVGSFKELLDVRNNVEKAIIYIKENENVSKFLIIDNEIYEYTVTRQEMDK
ncbi:MAG: hypothetical protein IJ105_02430 [Bacilli bacterium]|nr:hypothetical protein [Bacilli bacterium]